MGSVTNLAVDGYRTQVSRSQLINKTRPQTLAEWDKAYPGILDFINTFEGVANVILQLGVPAIGYGVMESRTPSGQVHKQPARRARTTHTYLVLALTGTPEEKKAFKQAITRQHAMVHSVESSPVKYKALDPNLQLWVAVCIYFGFVDVMKKFRGVDYSKDEQLLQWLKEFGTMLQVKEDMWPKSIAEFEHYWEEGLNNLSFDNKARTYLLSLAKYEFVPFPLNLLGYLNYFMTVGFLPEPIRDALNVEWSGTQQRAFDLTVRAIGRVNRVLPRQVRQLGNIMLMRDYRRRFMSKTSLLD